MSLWFSAQICLCAPFILRRNAITTAPEQGDLRVLTSPRPEAVWFGTATPVLLAVPGGASQLGDGLHQVGPQV